MTAHDEAPGLAIILAAGVGRRLTSWQGPKVLLPFDGKTLLERHIAMLEANGVTDVAITVGFGAEAIKREIERISPACQIYLVNNPDHHLGSMVSLWCQRDRLRSGRSLLLMDGDVLYGSSMIPRLIAADPENCLLVDREIEPGDEPVKICFSSGEIVDFRKLPVHEYEWFGEVSRLFSFFGRDGE